MELTEQIQVPYAPSLRWWHALANGEPLPDTPRPNRARVMTNTGPAWLTIPLQAHSDPAAISDHGRWPHVHFEALRAQYGAAPFFAHYAPEFERLYANPGPLLDTFCRRIAQTIIRLLPTDQIPEIKRLPPEILREYAAEAEPDLSILHYIFHLGPYTTYLLAAPLI